MMSPRKLERFGSTLLLFAAAAVLSGCVSGKPGSIAPPTAGEPGAIAVVHGENPGELHTVYAKLEHEGGKLFALEPKTSTVRIYAFRSGSAARLGHNHVLAAPQFTGYFHLPAAGTASARFDLEFRLDQLEFDNPTHRATLGKAFASTLTPESIESTRQHMLGENAMQANLFPFVRIHSMQISGEAPKFAAKIQVELHGQSREMWIPLTVDGLPDSLSASGSFVLRQTDFGVKPYSALGGILAIQDEIVIEFQLRGV